MSQWLLRDQFPLINTEKPIKTNGWMKEFFFCHDKFFIFKLQIIFFVFDPFYKNKLPSYTHIRILYLAWSVLFYKYFEHMIEDQGTNNSFFKMNGSKSMEKAEFLCFNPGCTVLGAGYFQQSDISLHNNCTGWIIKTSDIDRIMSS